MSACAEKHEGIWFNSSNECPLCKAVEEAAVKDDEISKLQDIIGCLEDELRAKH